MTKGKYIVIEGAEGVGKTTMVHKVAEMLQAAGIPVKIMREPDSQNDLTARVLRHLLLDPRYPMKTETEVLLFNAARSQSLDIIRTATKNGVTCLVDRSYLTTLANQYYGRGDITDYQKINDIIDFAVGDMQPDLMLVLDAPVEVLRKRLAERTISHGRYGELDEGFYERVRAGYLWEARQRGFPIIYASGSIDEVFKEVWTKVSETMASRESKPVEKPESVAEVLAKRPAVKALAKETAKLSEIVETLSTTTTTTTTTTTPPPAEAHEPYLTKTKHGVTVITESGHKRLAPLVSTTRASVYAFTDKISPITIAAAMARLSRRADDMRITLLDEFIDKADKDDALLRRVITAYGDDSVQQLTGLHLVIENASNLLTKKLEWGRLAAYLEQSTRYIYFDQKDTDGKYRYYVPKTLDEKTRETYVAQLDQIFAIYAKLVVKLTEHVRATSSTLKEDRDLAWKSATKAQACDAIRNLLPVATKSTVGIFASGQSLESLIMHLLGDDLDEAQQVGQEILDESRKVLPTFLERADKPERGGALIAYHANTRTAVKKLAEELLPASYAQPNAPVTLVSYTPHNELDIVADILYEHSDLSQLEIKELVAKWPYEQKLQVFEAYMGERLNRRHRPGRALENIHYTWDLVCDYGIFRDLQRHRMVDDLRWQPLTPRFGYDMPKLVEEAGLSDDYDRCFDISLALFSTLQAAGYAYEAQYATLLGHKMRWRVTMNAREMFHFIELRTAPQGHPGYRKLVGQMHEKLCEVHPLIGTAMRFVNRDEDPELTRLAAERYTQFKLQSLDASAESTNGKV